MRIISVGLVGLLVLSLLVAAGCDDDNGVTPTVSVLPAAFVSGVIGLQPGLSLTMNIYSYGADPGIDSVKVGDTLCSLYSSYYWGPGDFYYHTSFHEGATDDPMYESGDTADVTIYAGDRSSSCAIRLMNGNEDRVIFLDPSIDTTVTAGDTIDVAWGSVANADWYAIEIDKYWDSAGSNVWSYNYLYARDTIYAVPASFTTADVHYFNMYAYPIAGPDPVSSVGNWTGNLVDGKLFCYGGGDYTRINIGSGPPKKVPAGYLSSDTPPRKSAREVVMAVYDAYR